MTDLVHRLRKRAEIRRQISTRKSVQEGRADRISDLLEEAADYIESRQWQGLTDEYLLSLGVGQIQTARKVEAKLKEMNT
jgi:hypothetical protein